MSDVDLIDEFLSAFWALNPVSATFAGIHAHDGRLPDWSPEGLATEARLWAEWGSRLASSHDEVPDWETLSRDVAQLDRHVARSVAGVRLAEITSGHFVVRNPALWTGEAIFGVISLMLRDFAPASERVPSLLSRLNAIEPFLHNMQRTLLGPLPESWVARARRECVAGITLLTAGLPMWCDEHGVSIATLEAACASAASALQNADSWLSQQPTNDVVSCGEPLLGVLLRDGHQSDVAPRVMLERAESAMRTALEALDRALAPYSGSLAAAREAMAVDHPTAQDFLSAFEARWSAVRSAVVQANVVMWPDAWPLRYVPIPEWARAVQPTLYFLFYRSPAPFDAYREQQYLVAPLDANTPSAHAEPILRAWNNSVIGTNHVLHHGGIGHHVQNYAAVHGASRLGRVAAVDAASRIAMFQGGSMAEGWACYASVLAGELGLLTQLEQISEAHSAVRFLGRAIVDLRLHLGDWTAVECAAFLKDVVGMDDAQSAGEVTKASMFPGTALMYWLGTQAILDLRAAQQQRLGSAFSLRAFHDSLLSRGSLPVPLVARLLTASSGARLQ